MGIFPWKANGPPCQCLLPLHLRKGSSVLCLWAAWDYQEDTTLKIVTPLWMVGGINPVSHKEGWRTHTDAAWGFQSVCLAQRGPCFCLPMIGLVAIFCWGRCCVGTVFPPSWWGIQTYLPLTNGEPFVLCGFNLSLICISIKIYSAILESRRRLNCVAQSFNLTYFTRSKLQGECVQRSFRAASTCLFSVALFFPLPRSHWKQESTSLSQRCSQYPKENKRYSTWYIKWREEKNILRKYQTTYFMIFKCHFCPNIDFFMEDEL